MKRLRDILVVLVLCLVALVLVDVHYWIRDTHKRTNPTLTHADEFMGRGAHAMEQVEAASRSQAKISEKTQQILDHIDQAVVHADGTITTVGANANTTIAHVQPVLREAQSGLHNVAKLTSDLDATVNGPDIQGAIHDVHKSTTSLRYMMDDGQMWVHRATRPASTAKAVIKTLIGWGISIGTKVF